MNLNQFVKAHEEARENGGPYDAVYVRTQARRLLSEEDYAKFESRIA